MKWEKFLPFSIKKIKLLNPYFSENYLFDLPTIYVVQILEGQFCRLFTQTHTHTEENVISLQRPFKLLLSPQRQATHSSARPLIACITTRCR
jgi:hypothetical protein